VNKLHLPKGRLGKIIGETLQAFGIALLFGGLMAQRISFERRDITPIPYPCGCEQWPFFSLAAASWRWWVAFLIGYPRDLNPSSRKDARIQIRKAHGRRAAPPRAGVQNELNAERAFVQSLRNAARDVAGGRAERAAAGMDGELFCAPDELDWKVFDGSAPAVSLRGKIGLSTRRFRRRQRYRHVKPSPDTGREDRGRKTHAIFDAR
jgi:hypothetical protein